MDQKLYESLEWRNIGPHRAGRVTCCAGDPYDRQTFYFGSCGGGVWKTTDAGAHWLNITDGYFNTSAIGAIVVSEADSNVIYVGTGESSIRSNVSHGDGVYKSTDAGQTWHHLGLEATRHIGQIVLHPYDPDTVYVAALGHAWGQNPERGVYKSTDGGETWELALFVSDRAGAVDISIDPDNPRVLFATIWQGQRFPHAATSGGPDCGLWRTTDGGDSWQEITENLGLPDDALIGKMGVSVSPAQSGRVYLIVEADQMKHGLYRSDDRGESWEHTCGERDLVRRAWYYQHVFADPSNADTVWVLNLRCWKSIDGGRTFEKVPTPHGDNHGLWIDPYDSDRILEGNDGGASVSYDGGKSWSTILNQPTGQFYHVTTDHQQPYHVYGSQQDNWAMRLPSISYEGAISWKDYMEPGGGESGYIAIKPTPPYTVYGGGIGTGDGHGRLRAWNPETRQSRNVTVWPEVHGFGGGAIDMKYRFQWTFPIEISPFDPDTLYVCSNYVHVSHDEGASWETISPDLTRNDPDKIQPSGGPITSDNSGAEIYCTIFAFQESPHQQGEFWAGSDDGLLHISRDGGQNWQNINPPQDMLPEWSRIAVIELSPHQAGKAYVAANRYQLDDNRPYLLKTEDYGQNWTEINTGIAEDDITRTIREDPNKAGLLYCGTEVGLYVSHDDGDHWEPMQTNLPVTPVYDLVVEGTDLVVSTNGRGFWILDDVTPLHQMHAGLENEIFLYQPRDTARVRQKPWRSTGDADLNKVNYEMTGPVTIDYLAIKKPNGDTDYQPLNAGKNPPDGAIIHFFLPEKPEDEVKLTFADSDGNVIRTVATTGEKRAKLNVIAGANRYVWDLCGEPATELLYVDDESSGLGRMTSGSITAKVVPGTYQVTLSVGDVTQTQQFKVTPDPRLNVSQEDLEAQYDLKVALIDKLSDIQQGLNSLHTVRNQVEEWVARADNADVTAAGEAVTEKLDEIELELMAQDDGGLQLGKNGLREKIGTLARMIDESDHAPTQQSEELYANLSEDTVTALYRLNDVLSTDIDAFNNLLEQTAVPRVSTVSAASMQGANMP